MIFTIIYQQGLSGKFLRFHFSIIFQYIVNWVFFCKMNFCAIDIALNTGGEGVHSRSFQLLAGAREQTFFQHFNCYGKADFLPGKIPILRAVLKMAKPGDGEVGLGGMHGVNIVKTMFEVYFFVEF